MNKHILLIIDAQLNPGKYSKEQLRQNASEAAAAARVAAAKAVTYAAAYATDVAAIYAAAACRLIDQYFVEAKENKQDYIDEINRRGKK